MSRDFENAQGLSPNDQRLLDLFMEAGYDADAVEVISDDDRNRLQALATLFALLDDYPVEDADELLVDATLARVRRTADRERGVIANFEEESGRKEKASRRWRMPDFISVAAVLLIAASVAWPVFALLRQRSLQMSCVTNLVSLGNAFATYAGEWEGRVPMATAGFGGSDVVAQWVDPYPLVQLGYCERGHAHCPGHSAEAGYSRQVVPLPRRQAEFSWFTAQVNAILGDRNPVIDARATAALIAPTANSRNHSGRGQNMLKADGSTNWLEMPVVDADDNIWLVRGRRDYNPGDVPESSLDVFLAH